MAVDLGDLSRDFLAEREQLLAMVAGLDETGWSLPTPAPGWDIGDQLTHLAYFDDKARQALTDPESFRAQAATVEDIDGMVAAVAENHRSLSGAEVVAWVQGAGRALVAAIDGLDPARRVPWYGPDMKLASALTSRLMETWAHGQDVADTLGIMRPATVRLRHIALLGVLGRVNSFRVRDQQAPPEAGRVELVDPSGALWVHGPLEAADQVRGPMLDFCLAVTCRRHLDDLALSINGAAASRWMAIAQAYAGPPGAGRRPGQFEKGSGAAS